MNQPNKIVAYYRVSTKIQGKYFGKLNLLCIFAPLVIILIIHTNKLIASTARVLTPYEYSNKPRVVRGFYISMEHYKNLSLENIEGEEWKPITSYEGLYEVSNYGRIKSLFRTFLTKKNQINTTQARILKQNVGTSGYLSIILKKQNGAYHTHMVHRYVGIEFINNSFMLPQINHIDHNKLNNNVSNLEWCTQSHNVKHSFSNPIKRKQYHPTAGKHGKDIKWSKPVNVYTKQGEFVKYFESIVDASIWLGCNDNAVRYAIKNFKRNCMGHKIKLV